MFAGAADRARPRLAQARAPSAGGFPQAGSRRQPPWAARSPRCARRGSPRDGPSGMGRHLRSLQGGDRQAGTGRPRGVRGGLWRRAWRRQRGRHVWGPRAPRRARAGERRRAGGARGDLVRVERIQPRGEVPLLGGRGGARQRGRDQGGGRGAGGGAAQAGGEVPLPRSGLCQHAPRPPPHVPAGAPLGGPQAKDRVPAFPLHPGRGDGDLPLHPREVQQRGAFSVRV
mmetsp:Transcript_62055/g.196215  ORF Transcript_62055/g.196215 Transcript_62055/m.196215 type:complete len:228 (-) Transcript_62055:300-983(-)